MIAPFFIYLSVFGNQLSFAAWVLSNTIFVLLQVGMFIRACKKQKRRKIWAALIIVSAMSYAVSPPIGGVGIMYIPWALILLALLVFGLLAILRQRRLMGRQPISEELESGNNGLELRYL
jgi:peptidoglycan/LPS O-acetylase OafA/YrhL